ncbi:ATP-binding protein [Actinomadura sp. SCN-SB]|uniref:ATP-binding protein n=1 Tax=Actinomadura sp. SCN-SB TaxID=3373092 RepID=UPI0037514C1B
MTGAPGLPAGTGLPAGRSSHFHVPWMPSAQAPSWRIGDLLLSGAAPPCWPEPPQGEGEDAGLLLPAEPASLSAARDFVRKCLADWGLTELTWDATTVVSELFTNAITHAASPFPCPAEGIVLRVVLLFHGGRLGILVTDPSVRPPVHPAERPADRGDAALTAGGLDCLHDLDGLLEEGGRGLAIVGGLSRDWGWTPVVSGGKAVWAVLDHPADARAERRTDGT